MNHRTIATLNELRNIVWFDRCGTREFDSAITLSSWAEALSYSETPEWENTCLEMANKLSSAVAQKAPDRFRRWNDVAEEVRPVVLEMVDQKTKFVRGANLLPESFVHTVQWDIIHLAFEAEYADIVPVSFFAGQSFWYAKGHFPCGWNAQEKKMIIY